MTGRDVPDADMPNTPRPHGADVPADPDEALDALLAGDLLTAGTGPGLRPVAELLAALTAPPETAELAGHARALAEFRQTRLAAAQPQAARAAGQQRAARAAGQQRAAVPAHRRRGSRLRSPRSLLSARAAAAAGALAAMLGGAATAAYAGVLPRPVQQFAHEVMGAPAPHTAAGQTPSGPSSSARAAGLCTAYVRARAHGTAAQQAVALRKLAAAAGGQGKIAVYCATVASPGTSLPAGPAATLGGPPAGTPGARGKPSSPPGKPTAVPTPHGQPSSPAGKPTAVPTPHSTGKPSTVPGKPSAKLTP